MNGRSGSRSASRWAGVTLGLMLCGVLHAGAAEPSGVAPGKYIYEGGRGELEVKGQPGQAQTFSIQTTGANAHTCMFEDGVLKGLKSEPMGEGSSEEGPCILSFKPDGARTVEVSGPYACQSYCGLRGMYTGKYTLPTPECQSAAVTATRAKFKKRYDAKDYAGARELLAGLLKNCTPVIDTFDVMWIRNDLAITQHHAGDDAGCLVTLQPLEDLANEKPEDVGAGEPTFEDLLKKIAKATRTNRALCTPKAKK